mgnify:CR=1 FL=1
MEITKNEHSLIRAMFTSVYCEDGDAIWAHLVADQHSCSEPTFLTGKAVSGTMSSLVKKGLAYCNDTSLGKTKKDEVCGLTEEGQKIARELGPVK